MLFALAGCRTAAPDRLAQAEPLPAAPSEGLFSAIAKQFQASPNTQARPTSPSAARHRAASQKKAAAAEETAKPQAADDKTAQDDTEGLIEAFSQADPAVQAAARQQLAAMRNLQRSQAENRPESSSDEPTPAAQMSLPKPAQAPAVTQAVANVSNNPEPSKSAVQQAAAISADKQAGEEVAFAAPPRDETAVPDSEPAEPTNTEPKTKTIQLEAEEPAGQVAAAATPKQQIEALIKHFEEQDVSVETPQGLSQVAKLRMLYLLADQPDQAMRKVEDLSSTEQDYLRYQMMTMWNILDPDGSPSRTRRWEKSLENLRLASGHLAAATESLDVSNIAFCREVESFGRITPFKDYKLEPGQQVILYCEIDNFAAERLSDGYETHFQGSYDLFNAQGVRVAEQVLPADKQSCNNFRRDYFIAYRLYLPKQLEPGPHRIQLTIEDLKGKKYGQSTLDFEVINKRPTPEK